jgi:hypothetical protein
LKDLRRVKVAEIKEEKKFNWMICGGFRPPKKMGHFALELAAGKKQQGNFR